jgi:hypothetical protein
MARREEESLSTKPHTSGTSLILGASRAQTTSDAPFSLPFPCLPAIKPFGLGKHKPVALEVIDDRGDELPVVKPCPT